MLLVASMRLVLALVAALAVVSLAGCRGPSDAPVPAPASATTASAAPAAPSGTQQREIAILAGGCFWGMEEILRKVPGVISTETGYAGGASAGATYEDVKGGSTGHAESVRVVFDPAKITYAELLERWFFRMHDPTTKNRQGNDVGTQYRSAIFTTTPDQKRVAEEVIARVSRSGRWQRPIVTEVAPAGPFSRAEDEHQAYLQKHPGGYTCHYLRD